MINALKDLAQSQKPSVFLLTNRGRRMVQVFRATEVKAWNLAKDLGIENGLVLELTFNEEVDDNELIYHNFLSSEIYSSFEEVDMPGGPNGKVFMSVFNAPVDLHRLQDLIVQIVEVVYNIPHANQDFEWGLMVF